MSSFKDKYEKFKRVCDTTLESVLPENVPAKLKESMSYVLLGGGKRLRPVLYLAVLDSYGCIPTCADFKVAAAIECIHAYSLVHDDLPAMDNDDMRRGRPSDHKVFGEAIALLTGDALLNLAFCLLSDCACNDAKYAPIMKIIADCAGAEGMIGGQALEFESDLSAADADLFRKIASLKTGKLLEAAILSGCMSAGKEKIIEKWQKYAALLGKAFQLRDDLMDISGGEYSLAAALGESAETELDELRQKADECLLMTGGDSEFLRKLTDVMLLRTSDKV